MGASQSQPARDRTGDDPPHSHHATGASSSLPTARGPNGNGGLQLGRRISSFLRNGPDESAKRERSNSVHPSPGRPLSKRRRVEPEDDLPTVADDDVSTLTQLGTPGAGSSRLGLTGGVFGTGLAPPGFASSHASSSSASASASGSGSGSTSAGRYRPPPPMSLSSSSAATATDAEAATPSPTDEILADRFRSISTIRDALGPDWTPAAASGTSSMPAPVDRLLARFRRRGTSAAVAPGSERDAVRDTARTGPTGSARTTLRGDRSSRSVAGSDRDALFAPPTPPLSSGTSATSTTASSAPRSMSHRLSAIMGFAAPGGAHEEWADAEGGGGDAQPQSQPHAHPSAAATAAAAAAPAQAPGQPTDDSGRIPVGAVLVIQGLAQTHANLDEEEGGGLPGSAGRRRASEGASTRPRIDVPNLDQQARMIGNLLTVAAAATATTLLSPESLAATPSRSTAQSAMQTIIDRLRPSRQRPSQSVESTLGDYLRTVLRDNRRFAEAVAGDATSANVPAEFQDFLHNLQEDLIQAVRAYAAPDEDEGEEHVQDEDEAMDISPDASPAPTAAAEPPIPTFHTQRQQNLPGATQSALGVSGGSDGQPRRLNFFRAHLFPPVRADGTALEADEDPNAVVPSIFVGVRSVAHDPGMTTEDLVGHPGFPFLDGQVPEQEDGSSAAATNSSTVVSDDEHLFDRDLERELREAQQHGSFGTGSASSAASTASAPTTPRRTLRDRVLERLALRREQRVPTPLNTYLIYVIGGNYPRSHPVLAIPALVSGGPLSADDLQLVSELLGPAKPPTVTADEIERSGLTVVHGAAMGALVSTGDVLEASLDRCMVCLGDYEPDEDCRVLKCRHAFHKECVDHWLSQGRNSCPTCRTEAVDKTNLSAVDANANVHAHAHTNADDDVTMATDPPPGTAL